MYDFDLADLEDFSWDRFVALGWESVFVGYHSGSVIRTIARRWRDLMQGALGCPEAIADALVRDQVMARADRDLIRMRDPEQLLAGMREIVRDMGEELAGMIEIRPADRPGLLAAHARLTEYLGELASDAEDEQVGG